ncbi:MAG: glycosyltransferase [bacterium]|nr:glycosyltransferase [bacterium]
MKIGIDLSQLVYPQTGVANYLKNLVQAMLKIDSTNEYVLFGSSMRGNIRYQIDAIKDLYSHQTGSNIKYTNKNVEIKTFKFPPTLLDFLWNRLHIIPIEWLIGNVDVFISSDWTQPPTKKAKSATILYDLLIYKYPQEMHSKIVATQKRRLKWVKKECDQIICISDATKKDAMEILGIEKERLQVVYPGAEK